MWKKLAILVFVTVATPALAQTDEWLVDGGRYLGGQVPSYDQGPAFNRVLDYKAARLPTRLIERRSSAIIGTFDWAPRGDFSTGRDQMVSATGS